MRTFIVEFEYYHRKHGKCRDKAVVHSRDKVDAILRTLQEAAGLGSDSSVVECNEVTDIVLLLD